MDKIKDTLGMGHHTTGTQAGTEGTTGMATTGQQHHTGTATQGYTGTEGVTGTKGYTGAATETTTGHATATCSQEYFTKVEDRPIVKERVEQIMEHHPVEKEFMVETRATGVERESMEGRTIEHLGTTERIISEAKPKSPCE